MKLVIRFLLLLVFIKSSACLSNIWEAGELTYKNGSTEISAFVNTKDTLGHGIIHNINLKNSTIEDSLVYVDNKPKSVKQNSIIPLAFLECIKINNFKIAKTYLCDTMQNVSDSHFTEYFGKIDSIHYNTHCFKENVENYLIKTANIYKSYNFILNQGKIQDIEQVF